MNVGPSSADEGKVVIRANWLLPAGRDTIYSIISDFERMPEHFPEVVRALRIVARDGNRLSMEAEAASFGRLFPTVRVLIEAELLPGKGYRCSTHNLTFNTSGQEELLLVDDPHGTRVQYEYIITVRSRWLRPLFGWLTRRFGLPYWKRSFLDPLEKLASRQQQPSDPYTSRSAGRQDTPVGGHRPHQA